MRTFFTLVLALAVPAGFAAAEEKTAPIAPETTTSQLLLLRQKSVQKELKLDEDTVKKIMEFTNKEADEYGKALKDLKGKERAAKFEELEKANKKFLEDNLSADQRKRLEQVTLQVTGLYQLGRKEVAKALDLTEEQQTKFEEMQKETRKALREILTSSDDRAAKTEKLAKLREENKKKIMAVLTDEQKAKVKEIVGEPFKGEIVFEEPE
jgi:Spy/CpxP family protein refolding chaperone